MKLFGIDFSKKYDTEVETVNFPVSEGEIKRAGGQLALGFKVSDLELDLPSGVMNTAFFTGKSPRIRIMFATKHTDAKTIQKWLNGKGIDVSLGN